MLATVSPFPQYFDLEGRPLDSGYLYFGVANDNPETNPITVYWDAAGTQPADQPVRTVNGYAVRAGAPAIVYVAASDYSVTVKDRKRRTVVYARSSIEFNGLAALRADLASTASGKGAALVGYSRGTTVDAELKRLGDEAVSVTDPRFGADPTGVADSTAAFAAAHAASLAVYWPAGTYKVSSIVLSRAGTTVRTDGFATVIQQAAGTPLGTRVIVIAASDISLGSCKVKGNIATDTNEQNHAVYISSSAAVGNLSNITVGDIYGQDLRGDTLYIGAYSGYLTTYVRFGRISGKNVLRNVVSITGAAYVTGDAAISDGATGLFALDIEPDTVTCHDIAVGYVRGAAMGCQPPLAANSAYNIRIGMGDFDPSFAPDSTPSYASRFVRSALVLRNIRSFHIGHLKAYNHTHFALEYVWNSGEQRGEGIEIGYLDVYNVNGGDSTYNTAILASAINEITIRDGRMSYNDQTDCLILGDSSGSTFTRAVIDSFTPFGAVARYIKQGRFSNLKVNSVAVATAFQNCNDCTILDSDITLPTLLGFSSRNTLINVAANCSNAYYGSSVTDTTRINCTFGGVTTGFATQRAVAAAQSGEVVYGSGTATTVGAAGGASALPATPTGYLVVNVGGTDRKVPFYAN